MEVRNLRKHSTVFVYIALSAVVVVVMLGYQVHTNRRFKQADAVSCVNRTILRLNQKLVLQILHRNTLAQLFQTETPADLEYYQHTLSLVEKAQQRLAHTPKCSRA